MSKFVIALGGNALGNTPTKQKQNIAKATPSIVNFIKEGHEIILTHGNGPQVGLIQLAFEKFSRSDSLIEPMNLPECGAMSQGYIGFHLQNGVKKELQKWNIAREVVTVITQVVVDKNDAAFKNPTKPIGNYYSKTAAKALMAVEPNNSYAEDAGRGWRRMVASPKPIDVVEKGPIMSLFNEDVIVIACGGGGIPVVIDSNGNYQSIAAVIDKDLASAKLAELVDADYLLILTAVDKVALNWDKPDQAYLSKLTVEEAIKYCKEGHFAVGSMLPKIEAAIQFALSGKNKKAIITSLENALSAIKGQAGTLITQ